MMRRILLLLTIALAIVQYSHAQVTTSSISGMVRGAGGEALVGATVTATHVPTGTVYTAASRAGGRFDIQNVAPGGPYTIKVSYVGFGEFTRTDINIPLGERFDITADLSAANQQMQEVVVSTRGARTERTGAATNFSRRQLQNLPNISRSITAITRTTPQANGNSFAGMNYRYNNITIDGALFNNNFGRSGDGQIPGGGTSAISIDALDQIQVNIAPYDVRQAGFVGAGINAVTRRGTNTYTGTLYGYYRNQDFNGKKVKGVEVANAKRSTNIYGASVGGPIIKNKLFFFVNGEREKRTAPGQTWTAKRPGVNDSDPNATGVLASDLDALSAYLKQKYNYDPGKYEGYDFLTDNVKFVTRFDWNITSKHRFTARYNYSNTDDDDQVNANSGPNPRFSNSRRGTKTGGLAFNGANFQNNTKVNSIVGELNSNFSNKISNQLIGSFTHVEPKRVPNSTASFVDIMSGANVYTSFGTDLFSYDNRIDDKALNFANNTTINLAKHVVTAGISYDRLSFENAFSDYGGPSYYRFASLQDFLDNKAPTVFAVTYSYGKNKSDIPPAAAKFAQLGFYAQDAWAPSEKLRLTYGLRVDKPLYPYDAPQNPALAAVVFKDENGNNEQFDVSKWPKSRLLFSPRVGVNYDVKGDKNLVVRGGTGIFTGRIPFIWLVNQVADNGVLRSIYTATAAQLADIRYNPDRTAYSNLVPDVQPGTSIPSGSPSYSATASDFKMPQVWRSNVAVDKRFAQNYTFTLEGVFTKSFNNVFFRNANLGAQNGTVAIAGDNRPYYNARLNSNITSLIVMDNTNKGYSTSLTAQLQRSFAKNWEGFVAYTFTASKDINIGTSDRASSSWSTNNIVANANNPELGFSNFAIPHRVVASGSYRFNYANNALATTVGLYYSGSSQERYHFRYGNDINGDAQTNDMIYIPADPSQITFVEGFKVGSKTYTAQEQKDAFFRFVENNSYLRSHKGQYVERYGALLPWVNNLDLRLLQDFSFNALNHRHAFQFSVDVVNFLNLLNNKWGTRYAYTFGSFSDLGILGTPSATNNTGAETFNRNTPKFTFNPDGPTQAYQTDYSIFSTWGIQLGLRYNF
ncbi:TonB-dependent receptor [Flavisolibacter nicotianae]|uniref:TonB-dependent receptor n=1 Tax=Flavisolibacter nicotianae TaxID=2364882 RepID=UPI000EACF232|nr:TonB-dependent receptor [Flavisolibacter nicotianae]